MTDNPAETDSSAPSDGRRLEDALVPLGGLLVALGVLVWLLPGEAVGDVLGAVSGDEDRSRMGVAGIVLLGVFLSRYLLGTIPERPLQPAGIHTRAVESTTAELAIQPGIDVDGRLREMMADQAVYEERRGELTDDLRDIAIGTLCYTEGVDRAKAIELLESGEWTTNQRARALFLERTALSFHVRFHRWVAPRRRYRQEVWAAVNEICSLVEP